ncbi:M23 family metallopeptidase [Flavobacterium sp.]|uniref:M23 family metallopeptidase n=1 Tax=Flavobacterium sp. TaxID=239 RepID=UPI001227E4C6|nr:M23 family metallopeptidase [Flavobacterium sp.]RZJ72122.1 MAG: M23 family peptidase [Flavobacterium sp.]
MKKNQLNYIAIAAFVVIAIYACSGIPKFAENIVKPDARKQYSREIESKHVKSDWELAYDSALTENLSVTLPYGEKGTFNPLENLVYTYNVGLQEGEMLSVEVVQENPNQRVFIEILELDSGGYHSVGKSEMGQNKLEAAGENSGIFKVIVQPETGVSGNFFLSLNKKPLYGFPVAGKGNSAIQSFWGQDRDGGKRSHEGVDIFAKKGTPVVAVSDGFVSRTGDHGIGGKQVWLRTGIFGKSVYYAHLDEIAVESGNSVKAGDTLGFVGNTGNAKGGAHHLHFGIYSGYGAVNPLPFIYRTASVSQKSFPRNFSKNVAVVKMQKAILRQGPSKEFEKVGELVSGQTVTLLGQTKDWLHVQTDSGAKAFLHASLVRG